jgi:excisionase family DNA binding protein
MKEVDNGSQRPVDLEEMARIVTTQTRSCCHITVELGAALLPVQKETGMTSETREAPEVLTFAEAAKFLGISERTLRRWVAGKIIPHAKVGGLIRFRRAALREWLEAAERQTMAGVTAVRQAASESGGVLTPEEQAARVDAIAGKYAWVPTSVDDFIRRKQDEIDREDRGWTPRER